MVSFVLDDRAVRQSIEMLERAAANPRAAYQAIGAHFVFSTQRNIETEQAPDGRRWPALSPRTANRRIGRRRLRGYGHMLRVTNRLYQSISYDVLPEGVAWGSNLKYARIHQLGGAIQVAERQASITLKKIRRQGGGVRSRFVRKGTRGGKERSVKVGAHEIVVPARPYLGVSDTDRQAVIDIVANHLRAEAGA